MVVVVVVAVLPTMYVDVEWEIQIVHEVSFVSTATHTRQ